jgi:hypothetical protein
MFKTGFDKIAKVFVYRNIRKSKDAHTYSVKGEDGRVKQHTQSLSLINPEVKVSKKGMERVRTEGVKNVHAGIKGDIAEINQDKYSWREITYDPKKYETFVFRDTKLPVERPDAILLTPKGAVAGFQKVAAPAWIKKFRAGKLSEKSLNRVAKSVSKEREIKHLGMGQNQIADLVAHPRVGLSVRKIPKIPPEIKNKQDIIRHAKDSIAKWRNIRKITDGGHGFAHLLTSKNKRSVGYYKYSPPSKNELGPRLDKLHKKFRNDPAITDRDNPRFWNVLKKMHKITEVQQSQKHGNRLLNQEASKNLSKVKLQYPNIRDLRPSNISGGNIVDFVIDSEPVKDVSKDIPTRSAREYKKLYFSKKKSNT